LTLRMFKTLLPNTLGDIKPRLARTKRAHRSGSNRVGATTTGSGSSDSGTSSKSAGSPVVITSSNATLARFQLEAQVTPERLAELDEFLSLSTRLYAFVSELFWQKVAKCLHTP